MVNYITIAFVIAAIILYIAVYITNPKNVRIAIDSTLYQLFHPSEGFAYLIIAAFFISSMLVLILPKELIAGWIGKESGLKGILIGTGVGAITPGGPFLTFPILVGFYRAGAAVGPIIAFLTSWSLIGVMRIFVWEIPFLGVNLTLVRVLVSFGLPILVGILGQWLYDALGYS